MKIRFGIMGAGRIANKFAEAVSLVDCAELVAVASKSPQKAAEFANVNNVPFSLHIRRIA